MAYLGRCFGSRLKEAREEVIGMSAILSTRQRCANGDSVARTARGEGASEPTVRKCRDMGDMSPGPPAGKERGLSLIHISEPTRRVVIA